MFDKVADAQKMLWQTFDSKERAVFVYAAACVLLTFYLIGRIDGDKRERERREQEKLADLIAERIGKYGRP